MQVTLFLRVRMGSTEMGRAWTRPMAHLLGSVGGAERGWARNSSVHTRGAARVTQGQSIYIDTN
jgi:hypothetical protein